MPNRGRKAWLITWEWHGSHAAVPEDEVISAIRLPQTGAEAIKVLVEVLYAAREYEPVDKLNALKSNPYKAQYGTVVKDVPGEGPQNISFLGRIFCGHNPYLYARLVDNLRLKDPENPLAGLMWDERSVPFESVRE